MACHNAIQIGLPFPRPEAADVWPNGLGFDLGAIEVMDTLNNAASATLVLEDRRWLGTGVNWVEALSSMVCSCYRAVWIRARRRAGPPTALTPACGGQAGPSPQGRGETAGAFNRTPLRKYEGIATPTCSRSG